MVNPRTVNAGIIVPLTGADVDLWGELDVNPNMVAIDGMFCGVQVIAVTNIPVTLTSPAGFVATPTPGPTQAQNRVLRFTGTLTGNVLITLPLPGYYTIDNATSLSNFNLSFQGLTPTEVVAVPPGTRMDIYNDGANVRFVGLGVPGKMDLYAGLGQLPGWISACTIRPYLLCDGTIYNVADYPVLGTLLGSSFGGNGISTFGVPDLRGRFPLAFDGTGTRVTAAGCGINGALLGAAQDAQTVTLTTPQIPSHTHGINDDGHTHGTSRPLWGNPLTGSSADGGNAFPMGGATITAATTGISIQNAGGGGAHNNMPNTQVIGIWLVKT